VAPPGRLEPELLLPTCELPEGRLLVEGVLTLLGRETLLVRSLVVRLTCGVAWLRLLLLLDWRLTCGVAWLRLLLLDWRLTCGVAWLRLLLLLDWRLTCGEVD
jgi:hypothetical protein